MDSEDAYVSDLVSKGPVEETEAPGPMDVEGDAAAANTALDDFAAALGVSKVKDRKAALAAFSDLMRYC